jgi:hypothetical protein
VWKLVLGAQNESVAFESFTLGSIGVEVETVGRGWTRGTEFRTCVVRGFVTVVIFEAVLRRST